MPRPDTRRYTLMGNLLLGAQLEEFSTFTSTFNALFYMQLGGIEYATLAEAHDGEEEVVLAMVGLLFEYGIARRLLFSCLYQSY